MRRHTNERPYVCDICGMAFRQSTDLKGHKRVHTGDKKVLCTICGKKMATTGNSMYILIREQSYTVVFVFRPTNSSHSHSYRRKTL